LERAVADLQAIGTEVAHQFERNLRAAASDEQTAVMCQSGCAHCCYYPATISALEGIGIYRYLISRGMWTPSFKKQLQDHATKAFGVSYEVWLLSLLPCPLLTSENRCAAYPSRPLVCRVTFAIGDPHLCHPHRLASSGAIVPRVDALREYHRRETALAEKNGAHFVLLPISKAILLGEQIATGELSFERLTQRMLKEYGEL
jgi:Fe-S-cluster containining protein